MSNIAPDDAWHVYEEHVPSNPRRGSRWRFLTWVSGQIGYQRALEVAREGTNSYRNLVAFKPAKVRP